MNVTRYKTRSICCGCSAFRPKLEMRPQFAAHRPLSPRRNTRPRDDGVSGQHAYPTPALPDANHLATALTISAAKRLDKVYAQVFGAEAALVRIGFVNGTHALSQLCLEY